MEGRLVEKQITRIYVKRELLRFCTCSCLLSVLGASCETWLNVTDAALAQPLSDLSLTLESNLVFCSLLQPRKEIRTKHVRLDPSSDALGPSRGRTQTRGCI